MLRELEPEVGIVLFGYYNPIFVHGETRTVTEAALAGIDALLLVDLPVEESGPLRREGAAAGVGLVPLLTPTSSAERVAAVRRASADGGMPFVYYVSVTGVTGSAGVDAGQAGDRAAALRAELGLPVVVGFGIDSAEKARAAAVHADGVVAGTAIVRAIEDGRTPEGRRAAVERLVRELRAGVDAAES
jgi:tryptophan synthase alpha chain